MNENKYKEIIVVCGIIIITFVIIIRLYTFSVIDYGKTQINTFSPTTKRQNIIDRNGTILATDIPMVSLYLNNSLIENEKNIAEKFYKILDIKKDVLYKKIKNRSKKANLILIKRHLTPKEHLEIKKLGIASTVFEPDLLRFYPQRNLFSHILGYTDIDRNGKSGLEEYYDDYLKNQNNNVLMLTMDARVQFICREELLKAVKEYNAHFGVVVVSEIKTGNIISAVSIPDFNINKLTEEVKYDEKMTNRITLGMYEVGSVMKIFTVASGLVNKVITANTVFDVSSPIKLGNSFVKDGRQVKKTILTADEGFTFSSNKVMVQIIKKVGLKNYQNFMESLGMLEKLDLDIKQLSFPLQERIWRDVNLATMSYGYGLAITPMHIIQGLNTIMNNGEFISLRFSYEKKQEKKQILPKNITSQMKNLMKNVVEKGTGRSARIKDYEIGGKTGSAEIISRDGYVKNVYRASFAGAFPINDPKYSIFIMLENPTLSNGTSGTGGAVSAPLAKNIIEKIVPILKTY